VRTGHIDIGSLIASLDREDIRLPEIQRGYVWKPPQVAHLIDSLYRGYPTGSLLLWETEAPPVSRSAAINSANSQPLTRTQYLMDGQQRLTSLHRVFHDHSDAQIVFNVAEERFQNQSAATAKDPRWVKVFDIVSTEDPLEIVDDLSSALPEMDRRLIRKRIGRIGMIAKTLYYVEVLTDVPYVEVTDIFVRVNSRGRPLLLSDLALATLSARWPGVLARFEKEAAKWSAVGYSAITPAFLTRALAAVTAQSGLAGGFAGFLKATDEELETGLRQVRQGLDHLIPLLRGNADIETSDLLPSVNALLPLVAFLGRRPDQPLSPEEANALVYWLFGAFISYRYSGSTTTVLDQDLKALREEQPIRALIRQLGLLGDRLQVKAENLAGRSVKSPYFLLSYLAARRAGAKDWYYGLDICRYGVHGGFALEYHHVHPRARLRSSYRRAEINDLANLAFISARANKKISNRSPVDYFPELGEEQLRRHFVPFDEKLRVSEAYPEFIHERRVLLAAAMTELLEAFRPSWAGQVGARTSDPTTGTRLRFSMFGDRVDGSDAILVAEATANGDTWVGSIPIDSLRLSIYDFENSVASEFKIGTELVDVDPADEVFTVPLGPLLVRGSAEEWRDVLVREEADRETLANALELPENPPWTGPREEFPVSASE